MGVVYEAEQVSLGRRVALKVLPGRVAGDRRALERFRREAKAAARLHHTNIVPVFEVGRDGEVAYYAMQFIQGQGLDEVIDELARLARPGRDPGGAGSPGRPGRRRPAGPRSAGCGVAPERPARDPGARAVRRRPALRPATERLDRDAKAAPSSTVGGPGSRASARTTPRRARPCCPAAAMSRRPISRHVGPPSSGAWPRSAARRRRGWPTPMPAASSTATSSRATSCSTTGGVVWITDFGLAKAEDDGLTLTGDILGTLRYMAPERFRGEGDARADIYALGLTLYELLTLRPGFDSSDRLKLIEQIKSEEPRKPRSVDARIPRDLETIVLKAIEKDPSAAVPVGRGDGRGLCGGSSPTSRSRARPASGRWSTRLWNGAGGGRPCRCSPRRCSAMVPDRGDGRLDQVAIRADRERGRRARRPNARAKAEREGSDRAAETGRPRGRRSHGRISITRRCTWPSRRGGNPWLAAHARTARQLAPRGESPDRRGWEWFYLNSLPYQNLRTCAEWEQRPGRVPWRGTSPASDSPRAPPTA